MKTNSPVALLCFLRINKTKNEFCCFIDLASFDSSKFFTGAIFKLGHYVYWELNGHAKIKQKTENYIYPSETIFWFVFQQGTIKPLCSIFKVICFTWFVPMLPQWYGWPEASYAPAISEPEQDLWKPGRQMVLKIGCRDDDGWRNRSKTVIVLAFDHLALTLDWKSGQR